jgi:hypothetical protein
LTIQNINSNMQKYLYFNFCDKINHNKTYDVFKTK